MTRTTANAPRPPIRFPGITAAARRLKVTRIHLYLVLSGQRTSHRLLKRYRAQLKEAAWALHHRIEARDRQLELTDLLNLRASRRTAWAPAPMSDQLQFFTSLDFPGRSTLLLREIAERVGCSVKHLCNQVEEGALVVMDIGSATSDRLSARVPIECYREWCLKALTGPVDMRMRFLRDLPEPTRRSLLVELLRSFPAPAQRALARQLSDLVRQA